MFLEEKKKNRKFRNESLFWLEIEWLKGGKSLIVVPRHCTQCCKFEFEGRVEFGARNKNIATLRTTISGTGTRCNSVMSVIAYNVALCVRAFTEELYRVSRPKREPELAG